MPKDHFEFKGFLVVGDKRSGKTVLTTKELALKAWELWGKNIDFYIADDLYGLIDAVSSSSKPVHFVILDDQIAYLDSRNPMGNRKITEVYFTIAHELKNRAELKGGNVGGLVICAVLVQNYGAIDLRLRSDCMFTIFKTWDEFGSKYYKLNDEIVEILKDWKIRSNRLTDYEARKYAFIVDINNEGCIIKFDANEPKYKNLPFQFEMISGVDRKKEQRDELVQYLYDNFNMIECKNSTLKGELYCKMDEFGSSKKYIIKSDFSEIIARAQKKFRDNPPEEKGMPGTEDFDPNKPLTNVEIVYNAMKQEKIATINRIMEITRLNRKQVSDILIKYTDLFENVARGIYCLKGYHYTQEQVDALNPPKNEGVITKILIMDEKIKIGEE